MKKRQNNADAGGDIIRKKTLTKKERDEVIQLKEVAKEIARLQESKKMHNAEQLAEAWMKYIDFLRLEIYIPRHFSAHKNKPFFTDKLFSAGEIGTITRYLRRKKLIYDDPWHRHVVNWRKKENNIVTTQ